METNAEDWAYENFKVTALLTTDEWKILWVTTKKSKPPKEPPNIKWAYKSLGKLVVIRRNWQKHWINSFLATLKYEKMVLTPQIILGKDRRLVSVFRDY